MAINTAIGGQARLGNNIVDALNGANAPSYTNVFATMLDGGFANVISPDALNTDTDNWTPPDLSTATVIRASSSANIALTGLAAQAGRTLLLHNVGASDIQLVAESASSTAANRFALSRNLRLFPNSHALLWYDGASARWRVAGHSGAMAGDVIQVQSVIKTNKVTFTTNRVWTNVPGLSISITPKSSSNKMLVRASVVGIGGSNRDFLRLTRDGAAIGVGDSSGSRTQAAIDLQGLDWNVVIQAAWCVPDQPASTATVTYTVQIITDNGTIATLNGTGEDADRVDIGRYASSLVIEEICQ